MEIQDQRRTVLSKWVTANGGHAAVVEKFALTASEASYLSQVVNGYSIGERSARNWETKLKLPHRFLDQDAGVAQPLTPYLVSHPVAHPLSLTDFQDPSSITWETILKKEPLPSQFICAVPDDSLGQDTPRGTEFIFSTTARPRPGVAVIVEDRLGFRYLRRYVQGAGDQWLAAARHDGYATLRSDIDGLTILAVAQWRGDGSP